jgi:hypothetical protein
MKPHILGKVTEGFWPWAVSALIALLSPFSWGNIGFTFETKSKLLEKLIDVCSVGVGFWTTALTLLLALESRDTIKALKALGLYSRVADYFLVTICSFLALLVFCIINIAELVPAGVSHRLRVIIWTFLLTLTITSMMRSLQLLRKLLRAV